MERHDFRKRNLLLEPKIAENTSPSRLHDRFPRALWHIFAPLHKKLIGLASFTPIQSVFNATVRHYETKDVNRAFHGRQTTKNPRGSLEQSPVAYIPGTRDVTSLELNQTPVPVIDNDRRYLVTSAGARF
jgi:hypothetical protein